MPDSSDTVRGALRLKRGEAWTLTAVSAPVDRRTARFTAAELARYLKISCGIALRVRHTSRPVAAPVVVLSRDARPVTPQLDPPVGDGYRVASFGGGVIFTGGTPFGTLYAVYAFLRDVVGIRFLTPFPRGERIPKRRSLPLDGIRLEASTPFSLRATWPTENSAWYAQEDMRRHIDWMAKNGMNAICTYANYGWNRLKDGICRETARRGMRIALEVHAFSLWLPRTLYASHPEYFPLVDGERKGGHHIQRCAARPDAIRLFRDNALRWLQAQPAVHSLCIEHDDGATWCRCDFCRRLTADQCFARFYEPLALEIRKRYPETRLFHTIYANRWDIRRASPPMYRGTDMLFDTFCRCKWHPLHDAAGCEWRHFGIFGRGRSNSFLTRNLHAWKKMCDGEFMIYENTALHGMLSALRPNIGTMAQDVRRYRKMGVTGIILQAYIHSWKSYAPNFHVLARLMWDSAPRAEEAIRSHFADLLGTEAGGRMAELWLWLETRLRNEKTCYSLTWGKLSPADYRRIRATLAAAKRLVRGRDQTAALHELVYQWKYLEAWSNASRTDYLVHSGIGDRIAVMQKERPRLPSIHPPLSPRELKSRPGTAVARAAVESYLGLWNIIEHAPYGLFDSLYIRWLLAIRCWHVLRAYVLDEKTLAAIDADRRRLVPTDGAVISRAQHYIEDVLNAGENRPSVTRILSRVNRGLAYERRRILQVLDDSRSAGSHGDQAA